MSQRRLYLILYDITDVSLQGCVRGLVCGYAVSRQKSFYECWLTAGEVRTLLADIESLLGKDDRCHCFELDPRMLNLLVGAARRQSVEPFLVI